MPAAKVTPMRRSWCLALAVVALLPGARGHAADPVILDLVVSPLKNGQRAVVTWRTQEPTVGTVTYRGPGLPAMAAGPVGPREHVDAGTDHLVLLEPLTVGAEYEVTVTAVGAAGTATETTTFVARNAYRAWDADAGAYRANVLMRFDWDLTAAEMDAWSAHATEFARRVHDVTDGKVRLGDVILADSAGRDVVWSQHCAGTDCLSGADVVVYTGYGHSVYVGDRRVTVMWQQARIGGIDVAGSAIEFPRWVKWGSRMADMTDEWWTGRRLTHEFGHYAFWLEDQYDSGGCMHAGYDISIMDNDLRATEMDSAATPCSWQTLNNGKNSWTHYFLKHYKFAGSRTGPPDPGPHDPGPWFRLIALDRGLS